jgi:hypothetical protein
VPGLYSYVVVFSGVTVQQLTKLLDPYPEEVVNWYHIMPQCAFVVSGLGAAALSEFIRGVVPQIKQILVLDAETERNGWLPQQAWKFLRTPRPP